MDHTLTGFAGEVADIWHRRKHRVDSDFAITAWACSIVPQIRDDVKARMDGNHRESIEKVIAKLYVDDDRAPEEICHKFWMQFAHFQNKTGKYANEGRWRLDLVKKGKFHLWNEHYSKPYYPVFGNVACRTTSKILGIGAAERSWGAVKHLKTDKRAHLSSGRVEKQAILYSTARIEEARAKREAKEHLDVDFDIAANWADDGKQ